MGNRKIGFTELKKVGSFGGILIKLMIILILQSCGTQGIINGGPQDKLPPKLINELSSQPLKLNTKDRIFKFTFDEFVEAKDVVKQVQVSPPLLYIPKVRARGKEVIFELNIKEVLRDSTTYTINFGEAIGDLNEGNKYKNFSYVFSTGDIIDTMAIKGQVRELEKGSGFNNVVVMLYDDLTDSAIVKKKPSYSIRVDNDGKYEIKNIKKGSYNIFALKDDNSTYTYEEATEMIGFADETIDWEKSADTLRKDLVISMPQIKTRIAGKSKVNNYGSIRIKLNNPPVEKINYTVAPSLDYTYLEEKQDSLILHYSHAKDVDSIAWNLPMEIVKTAVPKISTKPDTLMLNQVYAQSSIIAKDTLYLRSQTPIKSFDQNYIIAKDTSNIVKLSINQDGLDVKIYGNLKENNNYEVVLYPGALTDIYDNVNDTIIYKTSTVKTEALSKIELTISELDSTLSYIVNLTKDGRSLKKQSIIGTSSKVIKYSELIAGQYEVLIIEDKNNNGRYDASNYWENRQAERRKEVKLDTLKEYWKLETSIKFKD